MDNRKTPIASFYANLQVFKGYAEKEYLPYTTSAGDVAALDAALDNILEEGIETVFARHDRIASAVRGSAQAYGLELFLDSDRSNTVTAIRIPEEIGALRLQDHLSENYNLLVATSLAQYADVILRIGHMGENAFIDKLIYVLSIIDNGLRDLGFAGNGDLAQLFIDIYKENN